MPLYTLILLRNVTKKIQNEPPVTLLQQCERLSVCLSIDRSTDRIEVHSIRSTLDATLSVFESHLISPSSRYFCTRTENVTRNGSYECKHRQVSSHKMIGNGVA